MKPHTLNRLVLVFAVAVVATTVLSACSASTMPSAPTSKSAAMPSTPMTKQAASTASTGAVEPGACATCAGKGMAPMVDGAVKSENGVQVIAVGIKDGYYSPNTFAAKSGGPIKVVFTGKATDCLANPTFKSLNKTVNIEKTGTGTIDLGTLKVGTYEFGCSMGMTGGKIVVQ